ncbi:MAG: ATP-binding protein, partial [Rhodothermales bacterium]
GLLRYRPTRGSRAGGMLLAAPAVLLSVAGLYLFFGVQQVLPWTVILLFFALVLFTFVFSLEQQGSVWALFSLRGVLLALFGVTVVLYPPLYQGMNEQRYLRMQDAAEAFGDGRDPQVDYAIREVLQDVVRAPDVAAVVALPGSVEKRQAHLDSAASSFLHSSLLTSLSTYDVSLTFFDRVGVPVGRHYESESVFGRAMLDTADAENLSLLRQIYQETPQEGIKVVPLTGRRETSRFQLAGIAPLYEQAGRFGFVGWAMARAQPQDLLSIGGSAFPRLLTPSGTTDLYADLSLAEFRDGVLVRSFGRDFGRYRLDAEVQGALRTQPRFWRREETKGQRYLTYYRRPPPTFDANGTSSFRAASLPDPVMAVRVPALIAFDHLFYLLRLMIAGLFVAVPLYVVGLYGRWQAGLLPPPRTRFRDRVLNAFLGVGLVSVVTVGIVGLRAVQNEDERDVRSGLQENLDRVEEALARNARGEMPYRALGRIDVDALAAQVGLDLNVYRQEELVSSSRPDLVRERLINDRLPIEAYYALYFDGYRFAVTEEQAGDFTYTVGFKAVPDERGRPTYVLSTATLPEQERIEEERSRTVAYLFGALLLLLFIVMLTAALLAGALTRPIGRLREGLEAAAQGRYQGVDPTGTHDEIGDLVQAFNRMQEQLAESRRKLAQQERQLAWREMARQVAHEIKNPLTPMKLSVQHLRRAYDEEERATSGDGVGGPPDEAKARRFTGMFDRITATLLEQIDALKRIADEFHSFARLPTRVLEPLDLGTVIREAAALMQEEETAEITLRLHASPLILEADREELRRIYINLIKNAIQAIPESRPGRIEVITTREATDDGPGWAYSTIKDNGTGIPADVSASIFEPNFSTKTSGTGLGLAIVKKGIEDLNGEIGFETEADVGTTFRVRLPLSE